jgi:hypothetical protein
MQYNQGLERFKRVYAYYCGMNTKIISAKDLDENNFFKELVEVKK